MIERIKFLNLDILNEKESIDLINNIVNQKDDNDIIECIYYIIDNMTYDNQIGDYSCVFYKVFFYTKNDKFHYICEQIKKNNYK